MAHWPDAIYRLLQEIGLQLDHHDRRLLADLGLTLPRFYTLHHVSGSPGLSLTRLSQRLLCSKPNTTRLVQSLEHEGFIRRQADADDGRAACLYLTAVGRALYRRAARRHAQEVAARFAVLPVERQARLHADLSRLREELAADPGPVRPTASSQDRPG